MHVEKRALDYVKQHGASAAALLRIEELEYVVDTVKQALQLVKVKITEMWTFKHYL